MKLKIFIVLISVVSLAFFLSDDVFSQSGDCVYECPGANCRWTACGIGECCPGDRIFVVDVGYDDVNPCVSACAYGSCSNCTGECSCGSTDCFTPDTPVRTPEGEEAIVDLTEGDKVKTFDPETGSAGTGLVQKTFQYTRNAYYKIRTKDGQELKVTGTHPLFAVQKEAVPLTFWKYLRTESLTKRAIDGLVDVVK